MATIGNSLNLFLKGGNYSAIGSGFYGSIYGGDSCILSDESGNPLLDESGNYLLPEVCGPVAHFGGIDLFISGNNQKQAYLNLFLCQTGTTNPLSNSLNLYLLSSGFVAASSINLYLHNNLAGVSGGFEGFVEGLGGDGNNEGYTPISNHLNLFIQRNENGYIDMFISGTTQTTSGSFNLYLNSNWSGVSGAFNLVMTGKDSINNNLSLYTHGW